MHFNETQLKLFFLLFSFLSFLALLFAFSLQNPKTFAYSDFYPQQTKFFVCGFISNLSLKQDFFYFQIYSKTFFSKTKPRFSFVCLEAVKKTKSSFLVKRFFYD